MKKYLIYSFKDLFDGNFQDNYHISFFLINLHFYEKLARN